MVVSYIRIWRGGAVAIRFVTTAFSSCLIVHKGCFSLIYSIHILKALLGSYEVLVKVWAEYILSEAKCCHRHELVIGNVGEADEGEYECRVEAADGQTVSSFTDVYFVQDDPPVGQ